MNDETLRKVETMCERASRAVDDDTPPEVAAVLGHVSALCHTVKQLRAELERGALCEECEQWEYNEDGSCRTFMVCGVCWNVVQAQLEQLRELVYVPKILPDDEEVTYQQEGVRLLRAKIDLQSQLEQVTKELAEEKRLRVELKQIARLGIAEVSSVGTALGEDALTDFRSRAIALCRDKADGWLADSRTEPRNDKSNELYAKCAAARDLGNALEQLK